MVRKFAINAMRCAVVCALAGCFGGIAAAATLTQVPLSGFYSEGWQSGTVSLNAGPPPVLTVTQTTSGFAWDTSFFMDGSSNPDVFNAIIAGSTNAGSKLIFTGRFSQSLLTTGTATPTYLGINMFNQDNTVGFAQNYNLAVIGSGGFPIGGGTADVPFTFEMPIVAWSGTTQPANGTGNFYVDPTATFMKLGLGTNSDGGGTAGFILDEVAVSVVPEPAALPLMVAGAGMAAMLWRRRSWKAADSESSAG